MSAHRGARRLDARTKKSPGHRLSHEERLTLIRAPFPTVVRVPRCTWGGHNPVESMNTGKKPTLEQLEDSVSYGRDSAKEE